MSIENRYNNKFTIVNCTIVKHSFARFSTGSNDFVILRRIVFILHKMVDSLHHRTLWHSVVNEHVRSSETVESTLEILDLSVVCKQSSCRSLTDFKVYTLNQQFFSIARKGEPAEDLATP